MTWFLFALLSVASASLANIFRKVLMRDDTSDAYASSIVFQLMGAVLIGIVAGIHGFVSPPIGEYPLNFFLIAVLWGGATYCILKAYQYLEASEVTILISLQSVVTIISALLFLGETFTSQRAIGVLLLFIAILVISKTTKKFSLNKGVLYSLGFSLFAGLAITNDTYLLRFSEPLSFLTVGFALPGILLLLLQPKKIVQVKQLIIGPLFKKLFFLISFYAFSAIMFYFAVTAGGQASQLAPINQSSIVVTIILATLFLKERDHLLRKGLCTLLVFLGVFLLK